MERIWLKPKPNQLHLNHKTGEHSSGRLLVAAATRSQHAADKVEQRVALEQDSCVDNPYWGLGWGDVHRRTLSAVAQ
jgi:hypothetical protein